MGGKLEARSVSVWSLAGQMGVGNQGVTDSVLGAILGIKSDRKEGRNPNCNIVGSGQDLSLWWCDVWGCGRSTSLPQWINRCRGHR